MKENRFSKICNKLWSRYTQRGVDLESVESQLNDILVSWDDADLLDFHDFLYCRRELFRNPEMFCSMWLLHPGEIRADHHYMFLSYLGALIPDAVRDCRTSSPRRWINALEKIGPYENSIASLPREILEERNSPLATKADAKTWFDLDKEIRYKDAKGVAVIRYAEEIVPDRFKAYQKLDPEMKEWKYYSDAWK